MSQAPELESVDVAPDTLAPQSPRASGPISVAEVPQPVYLTTQRASAETLSSFRFAAIFVASFGVTTFSVLMLYGGLLFLRPPALVEPTPPAPPPPAPRIVEKPVPATPMVVAEPGDDDEDEGEEASEDVALASVDVPEPQPVARPRPRPRSSSPRVVRITQDTDEEPEEQPEPEPEPEPEPPPPPPHPLSGSYSGKAEGDDISVKMLLRADGTARFEIGGSGGPIVATGVYTTRKADVLDFLVSGRDDDARISWNGTLNKGRATGKVTKDGQSAGRFAVSR